MWMETGNIQKIACLDYAKKFIKLRSNSIMPESQAFETNLT